MTSVLGQEEEHPGSGFSQLKPFLLGMSYDWF